MSAMSMGVVAVSSVFVRVVTMAMFFFLVILRPGSHLDVELVALVTTA
jgi:hypothetical protein